MDKLEQLIAGLQHPSRYDHPTTNFLVIQTHISFVILTGNYVYKIKKPLDLEFLDFSSLAKRRFYCQEEIRLNKKLAPEIYLEVVKITGTHAQPQMNGEGDAIEYAVKMREFPQHAIFDQLLLEQKLSVNLIHQTALTIVTFHDSAAKGLADNPYGTYSQVHEPVVQNFEQICNFLTNFCKFFKVSI